MVDSDLILKSKSAILIVDDDPTNLMLITKILQKLDIRVYQALSGLEALSLSLTQEFALVFIDVNMPKMNGFELANLLRQKEMTKNTPIIFMTFYNKNEELILDGYKIGAVDFIFKPLDSEIVFYKARFFIELYLKNKNIELNKNKLFNTTENLKKANSLFKQFGYAVSHDLRAPIRHIHYFLSEAEDAIRNNSQKEILQQLKNINESCSRMDSLINDFLSFYSISTKKRTHQYFDLNAVVQSVIVESKLKNKFKKFDIKVEPLPFLKGDKEMLSQVFQNLISNALKYNDSKVPTIFISCQDLEFFYEFCIYDNGIGFDQAFVETVFEPFKRLVARDEIDGSGIGLAICKSVIESHGGSISATSTVGQGSKFIFSLKK